MKHRLVEENIEERMLRLREVKLVKMGTLRSDWCPCKLRILMSFPGLADAALGEGTRAKLHKLSVGRSKPSYPSRTFRLFILFLSSSVWGLRNRELPTSLNRRRAPITADPCVSVRC